MRVGVFGGTGFLGRAVVRELSRAGHEVRTYSRHAATPGERVDVTRPIEPAHLMGLDAVVNLVGIKRASPEQSFEAAHVDAVRHILEACASAGLRRVIHVSVSAARPAPDDPYLDTKHRGETLVAQSDLDWTLLRPGVVYGPGDDMLSNLTASLRHLPLFPAPGLGRGALSAVAVEDVALAVSESLARPASIRERIDVVGPEQIPLAALVRRVASALELPCMVLPVPTGLMRPLAGLMERALTDPPVTRAQLGMLSRGVVGDPSVMRSVLGIEPRPLGAAQIQAAVRDEHGQLPPPLFGVSLRALPDPALANPSNALAPRASRLAWALPAAVLVINAAALAFGRDPAGLWWAMLAANLILVPLFIAVIRPPIAELLRPEPVRLAWGLAFWIAMYGGGWVVLRLLRELPGVEAQLEAVYAAGGAIPTSLAHALLPLVVLSEDLVWRCAVTLPLAGRLGAGPAILLAGLCFAAAHVLVGPPVLVFAAAVCGMLWSWLAIRTQSLLAPLLAHLLWDITALWLLPYR